MEAIDILIQMQERELNKLHNVVITIVTVFGVVFTVFTIIAAYLLHTLNRKSEEVKAQTEVAHRLVREANTKTDQIKNQQNQLESGLNYINEKIQGVQYLIESKDLDTKLKDIDSIKSEIILRREQNNIQALVNQAEMQLEDIALIYNQRTGEQIENHHIFDPMYKHLLEQVDLTKKRLPILETYKGNAYAETLELTTACKFLRQQVTDMRV